MLPLTLSGKYITNKSKLYLSSHYTEIQVERFHNLHTRKNQNLKHSSLLRINIRLEINCYNVKRTVDY